MYKAEKGKPFYYALKVLDYSYNIPLASKGSYFWPKFVLIKFFCSFVLCIEPLLHLLMSYKNETGIDGSEDIYVALTSFGCLLSLSLTALYGRQWIEFLSEVTDFNHYKEIYKFEKRMRFYRNNSLICFIFNVFTTVIHALAQFMGASDCKRTNEEKNLHEMCYAFTPIWLPFDGRDLATTIIIFLLQMLSFAFSLIPATIVPFFVMESTELLIIHMDILKEHFVNMFEGPEEISDKLRFCIEYHTHILRMGNRFRRVVKGSVGNYALVGSAVFGVLLNQILRSKAAASGSQMVAYLACLFVWSHSGQRIKDESSSIADAVLASNWYKADAKTMKDLAFVIFRCQTPICYEALPLGIIDYPLFVMILKTAYSYLTLLLQSM